MESRWWIGKRGEGYVLGQFALLGAVAAAPLALPGLPAWGTPWSGLGLAAGLALASAGALLGAAGGLGLGPNLSVWPQPIAEATLVQTGAYGWVRHPIYGGLILAAFGWSVLWCSWPALGLSLALAALLDAKAGREERWLAARFQDYAAYQARVRKLIPFVY